MIPVLQESGYNSCSRSLLKSAVVKEISWLLKHLNISGSRPSPPGALFLFSALTAAVTSSSVIGWSSISFSSCGVLLVRFPLLLGPSSSVMKYVFSSSNELRISVLLYSLVTSEIFLQSSHGFLVLNSINSVCSSAIASRFFFLIRLLYVHMSSLCVESLRFSFTLLAAFLKLFFFFFTFFVEPCVSGECVLGIGFLFISDLQRILEQACKLLCIFSLRGRWKALP